jgi:uncharacterized damage-inducible protein DinB
MLMNERERQLATAELATSRQRLLGLVEGLNAAQWTFQPGEGRWSIGQCLEHVTRVENRVVGLIGQKLEGPAGTPKEDAHMVDAQLVAVVPNRENRREAPEPVRPLGQWTDGGELLAQFEETRARSTRFATETTAQLRSYFVPHAAFGELDCYQWLLLLGLHSERHARQIEEIKEHPEFPQ